MNTKEKNQDTDYFDFSLETANLHQFTISKKWDYSDIPGNGSFNG